MSNALHSPLTLGRLQLPNRMIMAPMTRSRASSDELVTDLHVEYYRQRAGAGLIISEGVHPSADGKGYCRTPGIYNAAQIKAWRAVTDAVHLAGGLIACQIMHCGRVGHPDNKAAHARTLAPSAITCQAEIYTDKGMQAMVEPTAMTQEDITQTIADYRQAACNAIEAGFDAIELHFTSGYLPAQFLSTGTNQRDDEYGGSLQNRLRFPLALVEACCDAIGADRVGVRVCPGNPFNDLHDDNPSATFSALFKALSGDNLAWLHVIRMPSTGLDNLALARQYFKGAIIGNDSFKQPEAEAEVASGALAAVSFGRAFIANPDLVERFSHGWPLNKIDFSTLYTPGAEGFIDYPLYQANAPVGE